MEHVVIQSFWDGCTRELRSFAPWTAEGGCPHTGSGDNCGILFGEEVVEGFYGGEFVFLYVEDGVELGDVEDVLDFLGEA